MSSEFGGPHLWNTSGRLTEGNFRWDDLRFPAQGITITGLSAPPDRDADTGLLLFDGTLVETIGVLVQLPHCWKEGSVVRPHVHWRKTSDVAGGVVWSLRYKWFETAELEGDWSSVITATTPVDPGATQTQGLSAFGDIAGTGHSISSLFLCQLGRLPTAAGDTYEADVFLYEFDMHVQIDSLGSSREFTK